MKRVLKIVAWAIGALVALVVVAAIVLPLIIDPNDYRDTITSMVKKETGRELRIEGKMGLSVFPWLGIELNKLSLSNAPGFGERPFARIGEADVHVRLLPLLRKRVEVDTVVLKALELNLARNAKGVTNWDDLIKRGAAPAKAAPAPTPAAPAAAAGAPIALAVKGIELADANVSWDDALTKSQYAIQHLNLTSGEVAPAKPFPLKLDFDFSSARPQAKGHVAFSGKVTADLEQQQYSIADALVKLQASGAAIPGGKFEGTIAANAAADLAKQLLNIKGLKLSALGVDFGGNVTVTGLTSSPVASGTLKSNEFVPRDIANILGVTLPPMADASTLTKAALSFGFSASPERAALKDLDLRLDDSHLTGTASVARFAKPVIRYDLSLDKIDLDRYLPPPSKQKAGAAPAGTPASGAAASAAQLPKKLLRSLDIDGIVKVGQLKASNLRSTDIHATLKAKDGLFHLYPMGAKLYGGNYNGNVTFDVRGDVAKTSIDEVLKGVQAGPLLKDFMGKDYVTGEASLSAKMTASGITPEEVRRSLNGNAGFRFDNGAVNGINIAQMIRKAYAAYKKEPTPPDTVEKTDFTELSGTVHVTNGLARNDDLSAKSPLLRVHGAGQANLVSEKVDYRVETSLVGTLQGQGGKDINELKDVTIPIRVTGSFSDPKFSLDLGSLLEGKAKAEVQKRLDAEKQKVRDEAQKRIDEQKKKLQQDMQKNLQDMFKLK